MGFNSGFKGLIRPSDDLTMNNLASLTEASNPRCQYENLFY